MIWAFVYIIYIVVAKYEASKMIQLFALCFLCDIEYEYYMYE